MGESGANDKKLEREVAIMRERVLKKKKDKKAKLAWAKLKLAKIKRETFTEEVVQELKAHRKYHLKAAAESTLPETLAFHDLMAQIIIPLQRTVLGFRDKPSSAICIIMLMYHELMAGTIRFFEDTDHEVDANALMKTLGEGARKEVVKKIKRWRAADKVN
jgi:hypothetical protein